MSPRTGRTSAEQGQALSSGVAAPPVRGHVDSMLARTLAQNLTTEWQPDSARVRRRIHGRITTMSERLARHHGTPDLGNKRDPLDEAVFIQLTFQNTIERAQRVWRELVSTYATWEDVMRAPAHEVAHALRPGGLHRQRAANLKKLLASVHERFGCLSLSSLRGMATHDAESVLCSLPGMDIKATRCVLLYALDRAVFPVDSNAYRVLRRYGVIHPAARYRRKNLHNVLQELVPMAHRRRFHVNLLIHGQRTCLPRLPRCAECPLRASCGHACQRARS